MWNPTTTPSLAGNARFISSATCTLNWQFSNLRHGTEFLEVSPIEVCSAIYGSTACQESLYSTGQQASPDEPTYIAIRMPREAALGIRNIIIIMIISLEGWEGSTSFTFYRETSHNKSSRAQQKSCSPA